MCWPQLDEQFKFLKTFNHVLLFVNILPKFVCIFFDKTKFFSWDPLRSIVVSEKDQFLIFLLRM